MEKVKVYSERLYIDMINGGHVPLDFIFQISYIVKPTLVKYEYTLRKDVCILICLRVLLDKKIFKDGIYLHVKVCSIKDPS